MALVTLDEAKKRLSYEYDDKDSDISGMITSIEGYLYIATGVDWSKSENANAKSVAKEYVLTKLYYDYYMSYKDLDNARLTAMIKQLQYVAVKENG